MTDAPASSASWFVDAAESTPHALVLADRHRSIDNLELDRSSAALARQLLDRRAGAGSVSWLPILVDRSVESCIAVVAAIRSAVPFAPIDAALPAPQIAAILGRLGHPDHAVVARVDDITRLPDGVEAIGVDGHPEAPSELMGVVRDRPAVVVFTSGSTGVPKAVVRPWRMFDPRPDGLTDEGPIGPGSVMRKSLLLPLSFSAGLNVLTGLRGRSMHIADPSAMSGDQLLRWLAEERIGSLEVPPSLAATILRLAAGRRLLPELAIIRLFGEAFDWRLVEGLRSIASPELIIRTSYSATECGNVTHLVIAPGDPIGNGPVGVGVPSPDRQFRLEPHADGEGSQQVVVADPVALGYLDDVAGGSARFDTDGEGRRWWWSGDLVTIDADGMVHHRGRVDDAVKINGVLVEPAAAERVLRSIPGVARAAVLAHGTASGRVRLVAHVELDGPVSPAELRRSMRAALHRWSVPPILMRHEPLPYNANGKIDRGVLRAMRIEPWVAPSSAPRNRSEQFMCEQLAVMLDVAQVGIDDDLLDLGLDSLSAIEFLQLLADLGLGHLDASALADHRTVASIAGLLESGEVERSSDVVMMNREGTAPTIIGVPGAGDMAVRFWDMAAVLGPDQPLAMVEAHGLHRPGRVDRSVVDAARRVVAAADELRPEGTVTLLGHSAGAAIAYEAAQQLLEAGRGVVVVLLDPAFSPDTAPMGPTRRRRWWRLPLRALLRPPRSRDEIRFRLYARWPGPPVNDPRRYRAFHLIGSHAAGCYRPAPARFPVLWIDAVDSQVDAARSVEIGSGGSIRRTSVSGDHISMLHPPHVAAVVAQLRQFEEEIRVGSRAPVEM